MRVVVDGLAVRDTSLRVVLQHLLQGWERLGTDDEVHVVVSEHARMALPPSCTGHPAVLGRHHYARRVALQSTMLPRLCRELRADVLLAALPTTTVVPLPCPRAVIAYDLRYRLRPEQFSRRARMVRRISYDLGYRQADAILCISERTRRDLVEAYPGLGAKAHVMRLGTDHVDRWPRHDAPAPYAVAFGQFVNKNVDLVLDAWATLRHDGAPLPLRLVGVPAARRRAVEDAVAHRGLTGDVAVLPWLADDEFHALFASAALVVFPSDFEGFGLPAAEAMRLGIPVVVSTDPALLEVTAGQATVVDGAGPAALAAAVATARRRSPRDLAGAGAVAAELTWAATAATCRSVLQSLTGRPAPVASEAP